MQNAMAIKNRVKEFISQQGLKRSEFARRTGVSNTTIYGLCKNENQIPDPFTMDRICSTFRVQPGVLIEWVPDEG